MWRVEQVPTPRQSQGLALLVGAGRGASQFGPEIEALRTYLAGLDHDGHDFWWACDPHRPVAAALVICSPGRTATLLHSSAEFGLVPEPALAAVLQAAAEHILGPEAVLLQSLLPPQSAQDARAYEAAGFHMLAELVYMRQNLRGRTPVMPAALPPLDYRHYTAQTHGDFAAAIVATYEESLDCPALEGLRHIEDIIAGHKASGLFRPDLWTVAYSEGRPAGVVLLNQNTSSFSAEVTYIGVAKPFRGRGVGRALLAKAAEMAIRERFATLSLAVDAGNHYAVRLYEGVGYVETGRRLAYMRTWPPAATPRV